MNVRHKAACRSATEPPSRACCTSPPPLYLWSRSSANVSSPTPRRWDEEKNTLVKVRYLLGLSASPPNESFANSLDIYGMGPERPLKQYYEFANIDPANNISHSAVKFCGPEHGKPPNECLASISMPITEPLESAAYDTDAVEQRHRRMLLGSLWS